MYKSLFRLYVLGAFILAGTSHGLAQDTQVSVSIKDLKPEVRIDLGEGLGEVKFRKIDCSSKGMPVHFIEITYLGTKKEGVTLNLTATMNGISDTRVMLENTQWNIPFSKKDENWDCSTQTMVTRRLIPLGEKGAPSFFDALTFSVK